MIHLIATASKKLSKLFSRKNLYKLLNNEIQMVKQTDIILNIGSGRIVRNSYIDSVFVLLFRLVFEKNKLNKAIGILLIPLLLIIYFLTYPLNIILKSDTLTTGYFTTAIK